MEDEIFDSPKKLKSDDAEVDVQVLDPWIPDPEFISKRPKVSQKTKRDAHGTYAIWLANRKMCQQDTRKTVFKTRPEIQKRSVGILSKQS